MMQHVPDGCMAILNELAQAADHALAERVGMVPPLGPLVAPPTMRILEAGSYSPHIVRHA